MHDIKPNKKITKVESNVNPFFFWGGGGEVKKENNIFYDRFSIASKFANSLHSVHPVFFFVLKVFKQQPTQFKMRDA